MNTGAASSSSLSKSQSGFTLLELLIAITLLAMLSVMLLGGMQLGGRVWERSARQVDQSDETRIARDFIRTELEAAYPLLDKSDPTHWLISFIGKPTGLQFLAPMPQALGQAGFAKMSLYVEEVDDSQQLILALRPELAFENAKAFPTSILLGKIQSVAFSYFGAEEAGKPPIWRDSWKSAISLPQLVRLRITFAAGDTRLWPDLVVTPRILFEARCSYDSATKTCGGR